MSSAYLDQTLRDDVLLYVEDDPNFVDLFEHVFKMGGFHQKLVVLRDGEAAIAYLKGEGEYANRAKFPLPRVVLTDLRMPRVDGFALVEWIRRQEHFAGLPVIVLTVSNQMPDVSRAYKLGANSFLTKTPIVADMKAMLRSVDQYWFRQNITSEWQAATVRS